MRALRIVGLGLVTGVGWGVTARLWMRFIATDPSFTWGGTIYVLIAPALAGTAMGAVKASGRSWVKGLGIATLVPLGMGAGALMLPTILFGTLATRRRTLPVWARVACAALAVVPLRAVVGDVAAGDRGPIRIAIGLAWYFGLNAWMIAIAAVSIGSRAPNLVPSAIDAGASDRVSTE